MAKRLSYGFHGRGGRVFPHDDVCLVGAAGTGLLEFSRDLRRNGGSVYQLAFLTPGISPRLARFRKQIRQMPNFR